MNLTLIRYAYTPTETLGWLLAGEHTLSTIECPWIPDPVYGSKPSESCVPDGRYRLVPHNSTRFPNTYALVNETLQVARYKSDHNRFGILIHVGNTTDDIEGCIAVGRDPGLLGDAPAVLDSRAAMQDLRNLLGRDEHILDIRVTEGAPYGQPSEP